MDRFFISIVTPHCHYHHVNQSFRLRFCLKHYLFYNDRLLSALKFVSNEALSWKTIKKLHYCLALLFSPFFKRGGGCSALMVSSCARLFNGKSSSRNRNENLKLVVYLMLLSHVFILCGLYNDDFKNLAFTFLTLLYTKALNYPLQRRQKKCV